jgi:hypothetical protein
MSKANSITSATIYFCKQKGIGGQKQENKLLTQINTNLFASKKLYQKI